MFTTSQSVCLLKTVFCFISDAKELFSNPRRKSRSINLQWLEKERYS